MPQMAPIWWLTMFMTFIITYMITMTMMYFYNIYTTMDTKKESPKIQNLNWKW